MYTVTGVLEAGGHIMRAGPHQAGSGHGSGPWPPALPTIFQALLSSFLGESMSHPMSFQIVCFPCQSVGYASAACKHHGNTAAGVTSHSPGNTYVGAPASSHDCGNPVNKEHGAGGKGDSRLDQQGPCPGRTPGREGKIHTTYF